MMRHTIPSLVLVSALAFAGCSGASADDPSSGGSRAEAPRPARVSGAEARRLVQEEHATLLDVRTPGEFAGGHVDGAINVPVQELPAGAADLDRSQPVVVYCHSGARSSHAKGVLEREGFTVYDMGPMSAWPGS